MWSPIRLMWDSLQLSRQIARSIEHWRVFLNIPVSTKVSANRTANLVDSFRERVAGLPELALKWKNPFERTMERNRVGINLNIPNFIFLFPLIFSYQPHRTYMVACSVLSLVGVVWTVISVFYCNGILWRKYIKLRQCNARGTRTRTSTRTRLECSEYGLPRKSPIGIVSIRNRTSTLDCFPIFAHQDRLIHICILFAPIVWSEWHLSRCIRKYFVLHTWHGFLLP